MSSSTDSDKADIFMSIKPEHISNIASRLKTHEFRKYLLPASVKRIWFYTTAPDQHLRYVAEISPGKAPGEIDAADTGIGSQDFNKGLKESKYGYEILQLYELVDPAMGLSLPMLKKNGFAKGPPQKYQFVKQEMMDYFELDKQKKLF